MIVIATPTPGRRIRKPNGQILKAGGEPVERDSYWLRREKDGDVRLSEPPKTTVTAANPEVPAKPKK